MRRTWPPIFTHCADAARALRARPDISVTSAVALVVCASAPLQHSAAPPADTNNSGQVSSEQPPDTGSFAAVTMGPSSGMVPASALLRVPVSGIVPGAREVAPDIRNPLANDP